MTAHATTDCQAATRFHALVLVASLAVPVSAMAASAPHIPSTVEPGVETPPSTPINPPPDAQFDFTLPPPAPSAVPKDVETLRFEVRKITVEGTTVFTHGDLMPIIDPLIGPRTSLAEIAAAATAIEARYRDEGFLVTRAFVPEQRTRDGEFRIVVIEAHIKSVIVDGADDALKERIEATLAPTQKEKPLTVATMERALLLVNDIPGVHAVGLLKPSPDEVGAVDLQVSVAQDPIALSAGIDNRASRYSGPWIANTDVAINGLASGGDQLGAGVTSSIDPHKQRGYRAHFVRPLGTDGLTSTTSIERTLGQPGYTLTPLGIVTDSLSIAERLSYPIFLGRSLSLYIDGGLTWKSAKTDALGVGLSNDQWRVADVKLSISQSGWLNGLTAASLDIARGLPIERASHLGEAGLSRPNGDPDFTKFVFDVRRVQPLTSGLSLTLAAAGQHAYTGLLAGEQFALGGYQYGRGFDPAALTGDNGLGGSAELHYDIHPSFIDSLQTYVFYDKGVVRNHDSVKLESLSSAGLGLRVPLSANFDISVEGDRALHGPAPTVSDNPLRVFLSIQGRL